MKKNLFVFLCVAILILSPCLTTATKNPRSKTTSSFLDEGLLLEMTDKINVSVLHHYHDGLMRFGPRYTGSLNCSLAAQYIYDSFEDMGLAVEFHDWSYGGFTSRDVVATLPGTDTESTAEYILCGHFDTVAGAPGADDDGSGTAAVLAIASVLRQYGFNHTIRFITFSGEEVGTYGSFTYAREAYYRGDNIVAVLNMDMIGYASTTEGGGILRFFHPPRSEWIADDAAAIAAKYNDQLDMLVDIFPNYRGADDQAFVDYGYDGVWIAHQDGYPWGHSPNDTADNLNWSYYVKATKLMLVITAEFAEKTIDVQVIIRRPYEGHLYLFNHPLLETSFGKRWFGGLRGSTSILGGKTIASAEVVSPEAIKYVIFCVDGNFMVWDSEPPYEWQMQGMYYPIIGKHTLKVYAYTTSGKVASDEMDIFILSLSTAYQG